MLLINISPEEFSFCKLFYHPTKASRPLWKAENQGIANAEHSLCVFCSGVSVVGAVSHFIQHNSKLVPSHWSLFLWHILILPLLFLTSLKKWALQNSAGLYFWEVWIQKSYRCILFFPPPRCIIWNRLIFFSKGLDISMQRHMYIFISLPILWAIFGWCCWVPWATACEQVDVYSLSLFLIFYCSCKEEHGLK